MFLEKILVCLFSRQHVVFPFGTYDSPNAQVIHRPYVKLPSTEENKSRQNLIAVTDLVLFVSRRKEPFCKFEICLDPLLVTVL